MESTGDLSSDTSTEKKWKRSNRRPPTFPLAAAARVAEITEEYEEELVECLMILAKGICPMDELRKANQRSNDKLSSRRFDAMETSAEITLAFGKDGYECQMCGRSFTSFQALSGHSGSHKQPKFTPEITKESFSQLPSLVNTDEEEEKARINTKFTSASLRSRMVSSKGKEKLHECLICGEKFSSGQGLGGHMTRHRRRMIMQPLPQVASCPLSSQINKLPLDLSLPVPEVDHEDSNCELAPTSPPIVFSVTY